MKAKFGAIITDGRGKIGGHVMSKNKYAAYMRTKVTPVNPNTSYQQGVRSVFAGISQSWRALAQSDRDSWNLSAPEFTRTNVFGDNVPLSGFNLFMRLNLNLIAIGQATIDAPPAQSAVPGVLASVLTVDESSSSVSLAYTGGPTAADIYHQVFATAPLSPGKQFVSSELRQIAVIAPAAATPYVASAAYIAKFGSVGLAGQKIFMMLIPTDSNTGIPGTSSQVDTLVVA